MAAPTVSVQHIGPIPVLVPSIPGFPLLPQDIQAATTGGQAAVKVGQGKSPLPSIGKGLSDLLGTTGISELLVRGLEFLAGAALILLGLQALTGSSVPGPVAAVAKVAR